MWCNQHVEYVDRLWIDRRVRIRISNNNFVFGNGQITLDICLSFVMLIHHVEIFRTISKPFNIPLLAQVVLKLEKHFIRS